MALKLKSGITSLGKANGYYRVNLGSQARKIKGSHVYVNLGIKVSPETEFEALKLAGEIDSLYSEDLSKGLIDSTFKKYNPKKNQVLSQCQTFRFYLENLEVRYFERNKRTKQSETTFSIALEALYYECQDFLEAQVSEATIKAVIVKSEHGSGKRQCIMRYLSYFFKYYPELQKLKDTFSFDLADFRGDYEPKIRNIPTDAQIIEGFHRIRQFAYNPWEPQNLKNTLRLDSWGWVYGMLATYGLRSHEILAVNIDESFNTERNEILVDPSLCEGTKTNNSRIVFPLDPSWVERFELKKVKIPEEREKLTAVIKGKKVRRIRNQKAEDSEGVITPIQSLIFHKFTNKKVGFNPYDLRHAYAIRGFKKGLDISLRAKMMGHSVATHESHYQRYIDQLSIEEPYLIAIGKASEKELGNRLLQQKNEEIKVLTDALNSTYKELSLALQEIARLRPLVPKRKRPCKESDFDQTEIPIPSNEDCRNSLADIIPAIKIEESGSVTPNITNNGQEGWTS